VLVLVLVLEVKCWLAPREDLTHRSYWSHKSLSRRSPASAGEGGPYPVAASTHSSKHLRSHAPLNHSYPQRQRPANGPLLFRPAPRFA
jgi:hypothetical protein